MNRVVARRRIVAAVLGGATVPWVSPAQPIAGSTLVLWMLADDISGNDGDVVSAWTSKEGNSYSFAQSDDAKRPLLKKAANGINGKNVVLFDGSNDILVCGTAFLNSEAGTVFAVWKFTSTLQTGTGEILASSDTEVNYRFCRQRAIVLNSIPNIEITTIAAAPSEKALRGSTTVQAGTTYLGMWRSNGTASSMRLNGADETITVRAGSNTGDWYADISGLDNVTIGAGKHTSEAQHLKGSIAEIIVYNTSLGAADVAKVESYLATRYGVTLP